jgi:hypothetical protein
MWYCKAKSKNEEFRQYSTVPSLGGYGDLGAEDFLPKSVLHKKR